MFTDADLSQSGLLIFATGEGSVGSSGATLPAGEQATAASASVSSRCKNADLGPGEGCSGSGGPLLHCRPLLWAATAGDLLGTIRHPWWCLVRFGVAAMAAPSENMHNGTKHAKHVACAQMALAKTLRAMRRRKHTCACGSVTAQAAAAEACERMRHMHTRSGTSRPTHGPKDRQPH